MTTSARILALAMLTLASAAAPAPVSAQTGLAFFVDPSWKTSNASVQVDAAGGTHVAFYYYERVDGQRPTYAVYQYCASQCGQAGSWEGVGFGERVREVELELTPVGAPRLLITTDSTVFAGGKDYYYAACDTGCTEPAGWSFTNVASGWTSAITLENDDELAQHAFELDGQGRPRFVYRDENYRVSPSHAGLFYLACDTQCDDAAQWQETLVTTTTANSQERVYHPALAVTADGRPRIVSAEFFPIGSGSPSLAYFACEAGCDVSANWQKVALMPRGGGAEPSADIEVDVHGRPRVAFYQEAMLNSQGKRLFYLTCDDRCLEAGSWSAVDLGLGAFNGQEPDLELDQQGRPVIAYADWDRGGPGLAWCDASCGSAAGWQHRLLEDRNALYRAWPVAYPPHCDGGLWNAHTPSLSLAAGGTSAIAYDATYYAHCLYDDDPTDNIPPTTRMHLIARAVRLVSVDPAPSVPGAPVNVRATASGNTLSVSWSAPSGSAPAGYTLLARFSPGGPVVASLPLGLATSFSAVVPNGTYILSVQATSTLGAGPESAPVTIAVPQASQAPSSPLLTVAVTGSTVSFSWTVPPGGGAPDSHTFEAGSSAGFTAPLAVVPVRGATGTAFADVPPGTYYARVTAHNAGGASPRSNEVTFTVAGATRPAPPVLHAPAVQGHDVTLSWSPGAGGTPSSYTLLARLTPDGPLVATVPLAGAGVSLPLVPSGVYYLRLTATNAAGTSTPSAEVTLVVP